MDLHIKSIRFRYKSTRFAPSTLRPCVSMAYITCISEDWVEWGRINRITNWPSRETPSDFGGKIVMAALTTRHNTFYRN